MNNYEQQLKRICYTKTARDTITRNLKQKKNNQQILWCSDNRTVGLEIGSGKPLYCSLQKFQTCGDEKERATQIFHKIKFLNISFFVQKENGAVTESLCATCLRISGGHRNF